MTILSNFTVCKKTATFAALLLATTALAVPPVNAATEQSPTPAPATDLAQETRAMTFAIPAQPLAQALARYSDVTGVSFAYKTGDFSGIQSPGVTGSLSPADALTRLLSGTDIAFEFTGAHTVALSKPAAINGRIILDTVSVEGQRESAWGPVQGFVAKRSATGSKTDTPINEVPQSVSVVTRDQMDALGARTVGDALTYHAGVTTGMRGDSAGLGGDNISIRGFAGDGTAGGSQNSYLDGLRLQGTNYATGALEPYLYERVEVLRGPTSVLYGQNQPGGVINRVTKRPSPSPMGEAQVRGGSFSTKELDLDVSGALSSDGKFIHRFVGVLSDQQAQTDHTGRRRKVIAPSISWLPTDDTTLTVQTFYQRDDIDGGFIKYVPAVGSLVDSEHGAISRDLFTGDPNYDKWERDVHAVSYSFDHRFNDNLTIRQNARYMRNDVDLEATYLRALNADHRTITRNLFGADEYAIDLTVDTQVEARVDTGPVKHLLLAGADWQRHDGDTLRRSGAGTAPTLDLYAPVYYQAISQPSVYQSTDYYTKQFGIYGQDQLKFGGWVVTLGGRHDWARSETTNNLTLVKTVTNAKAFTGRAGLGYAFDFGLTPYISLAESFEPQSGSDFSGKAFEPTTGEQYEVGLKYEPTGYNAFATLSVYQLKQQNVLTTDPVNTNFSVQTGEVRSRGLELEGSASLKNGWSVTASYTYLDQTITKSNDDDVGNRLTGIPKHRAGLWAGYRFDDGPLNGLQLGGGTRFVGSTEGDSDNTFDVQPYMLFDASAQFDLSALNPKLEGINFAVNATNLADKTYVASCTSYVRCYYGIGRTVIARLNYKW